MGRYTLDGKRYAVYGSTFEEVRISLTEKLANLNKGNVVSSSNYTISDWLQEWLSTYALPTVKQSTYISYESYARLHLIPALGSTKLAALSGEQLQRFFNQKQKDKRPLSPKSLRNIYNTMIITKLLFPEMILLPFSICSTI